VQRCGIVVGHLEWEVVRRWPGSFVSRSSWHACILLGALAALLPARTARADDGVTWNEDWSRVAPVEYVATAAFAGGILATQLAMPEPSSASWEGPVLADSDVRLGLRAGSPGGRHAAATGSDVLVAALVAWPLVDTGIAWVGYGEPEVAAQMLAMNAQAFALTFLVTELTKRGFRRERPFGNGCDSGAESPEDCSSSNRYESFISGHTSTAFTGAGLVCAHHGRVPLYGGRAADGTACGAAIAMATTVGALRIAADRHYLSDVLAGATLGLLSGYLLPSWLHYDIGGDDPDTGTPEGGTLTPMAARATVGLGWHRIWY